MKTGLSCTPCNRSSKNSKNGLNKSRVSWMEDFGIMTIGKRGHIINKNVRQVFLNRDICLYFELNHGYFKQKITK